MQDLLARQEIPGLSIGIVRGDEVLVLNNYGVVRLGSDRPLTSDISFHLASITKTFVATAIMQLVADQRVQLDKPVADYIPYFQLADTSSVTITVRQLLNHTAGVPDRFEYSYDQPEYDDAALGRFVRSLAERTSENTPGATYSYSNSGYSVLGDVIANVSQMPFEDFIRRRILDPLAMEHSALEPDRIPETMVAAPHLLDSLYALSVSDVYPYNRPHAPSGGMRSSLSDMIRWMQLHLGRGTLDGVQVLPDSIYDIWWSPSHPEFEHIGLGWFLGEHQGFRTVGHSGGDPGFSTNMVLIPEESIGVVVLSNYERASVVQLAEAALDAALGLDPSPVPSIEHRELDQLMYRAIVEHGVEEAVAIYRRYQEVPPGYDFNQTRMLMALGSTLLRMDRAAEAVEIFTLNTEQYPQFAFLQNMLARALITHGRTSEAVSAYQRALELEPENVAAIEGLKQLEAKIE